ncbi:MAG: hypothetical protein JSV38_04600 [Desulfobacterales bacterium]|nr:MAG: hypothetical protein JSV38_04600 [Desulfobacterales bacterium]
MKNRDSRAPKNSFGVICFFLMLSIITPFISGCSFFSSINTSSKRMIRDIRSPHKDIKKKVGITFFENKTSFLKQVDEQRFVNDLVENMKKSCPDEILVKPGDINYPEFLVKLPKNDSGWINTLKLANASRQLGFNAILTGAITDIIKKQEERGFWLFKDTYHYFETHISVEVYDTLTGAKLLDERFSHEMEVDEIDFEGSNTSANLMTAIIKEAYSDIASDMGEHVCNEIVLQPWQGYITFVDADKIIITSGKTTGIKSGNVFEVYDSSEIFNGSAGQQFFIPGLKIGEIKITEVLTDSAEAVKISGQNIRVGSFIRPK